MLLSPKQNLKMEKLVSALYQKADIFLFLSILTFILRPNGSDLFLLPLVIYLILYLTNKKSQQLYGEINFEYPVNPEVNPSDELQSWGKFREDKLPIINIAKLAPLAQKIIDRSGW